MGEIVKANGDAFPESLAADETQALKGRRKALEGQDPDSSFRPVLGVGLSGGGIRSATFALGLFQALARLGLTRRIDYLSTVSGGGYFGAFFQTLFSREVVDRPEDAESILLERKNPEILRSLRQNGRYLSPNGSGDLLLSGAVLLRNWVALQIVLLTLLLALFLGMQMVAVLLGMGRWPYLGLLENDLVWCSPWLLVAAALFVLWALPAGWAYWFVGKHGFPHPALGLAAVLGFGIWSIQRANGQPGGSGWTGKLGAATIAVCVVALLFWLLAKWKGSHLEGSASAQEQRTQLSQYLKVALVATGAVLTVALVDTLALTAWASLRGGHLLAAASGLGGSLLAVMSLGKRITVLFSGGGGGGARPKLPMALLATVGAGLLITVLLVGVDVLALGFRWQFGEAPGELDPLRRWARTGESRTAVLCCQNEQEDFRLEMVVPARATGGEPPQSVVSLGDGTSASSSRQPEPSPAASGAEPLRPFLYWSFGIAMGASLLFGHTRTFLNRSSHHALYSARLSRAYLGASNPERTGGMNLSDVSGTDEPSLATYWSGALTSKGAPIHLINVTINETMNGETGIQQQDRKGVGMALGPAGLSLGVRHHLSLDWARVPESAEAIEPGAWKVFRGPYRTFEKLSLGDWVGLSGAAFSTGTGYHTSFGLSFLAGFANVRLGHWWDPGNQPKGRPSLVEWLLFQTFPVQSYLLSEFFARFPGTSRKWWYLSDGGHFENMGGYELIRRRLSRIVIVDAECDPKYRFEGLANLVRKARLDFRTEIDFWPSERIEAAWKTNEGSVGESDEAVFSPSRQIGSLQELHDGQVAADHEGAPRNEFRPHAAIADVRYLDDSGKVESEGLLLYVKPSLSGDESIDILQYKDSNPPFPQQTTADQFFDEAQWESYRKLGEHIGGALLGGSVQKQPTPMQRYLRFNFFGVSRDDVA